MELYFLKEKLMATVIANVMVEQLGDEMCGMKYLRIKDDDRRNEKRPNQEWLGSGGSR